MIQHELIAALQEFQERTGSQKKLLDQLEKILGEEKHFIESSDLPKIESNLQVKQEFEDNLRQENSAFLSLFEYLTSTFREIGVLGPEKVDLEELFSKKELFDYSKDDFDQKLIAHEWLKCCKLFHSFFVSYKRTRLSISSNRYLVSQLLQHHRQTYYFWQSIAAESQATYGAKGKPQHYASQASLTIKT